MRAVIVYNPKSGGGGSAAVAARLERSLGAGSIDTVARALDTGIESDEFSKQLARMDAAVLVGGDGTVHAMLGTLARSRTPVYVVPTGTENIFARQFAMNARELDVRRAIVEQRVTEIDLGDSGGRLFSLMCGVGFDGAVIGSMAAARRGPIRRWSYLPHVFHAARSLQPTIAVEVDGCVIVSDLPGSVIVANGREYVMHADPASSARLDDGLLDVVFMPAKSGWRVLAWLAAAKMGLRQKIKGLVYATGKSVRIATDPAGPSAWCQMDGEATGALHHDEGPGEELEIVVRSRALRVLLP